MDWKGENDGWILSKYIVCIHKILNKKKIIEREKRGRKGSRENAELSKNQLKF